MVAAITIKEGSEGDNDEDGNELDDGESRDDNNDDTIYRVQNVPCTILRTCM